MIFQIFISDVTKGIENIDVKIQGNQQSGQSAKETLDPEKLIAQIVPEITKNIQNNSDDIYELKQIVTKTASDIKLIQELVQETNNGSKEFKKLHDQLQQNSNAQSEYLSSEKCNFKKLPSCFLQRLKSMFF